MARRIGIGYRLGTQPTQRTVGYSAQPTCARAASSSASARREDIQQCTHDNITTTLCTRARRQLPAPARLRHPTGRPRNRPLTTLRMIDTPSEGTDNMGRNSTTLRARPVPDWRRTRGAPRATHRCCAPPSSPHTLDMLSRCITDLDASRTSFRLPPLFERLCATATSRARACESRAEGRVE